MTVYFVQFPLKFDPHQMAQGFRRHPGGRASDRPMRFFGVLGRVALTRMIGERRPVLPQHLKLIRRTQIEQHAHLRVACTWG